MGVGPLDLYLLLLEINFTAMHLSPLEQNSEDMPTHDIDTVLLCMLCTDVNVGGILRS